MLLSLRVLASYRVLWVPYDGPKDRFLQDHLVQLLVFAHPCGLVCWESLQQKRGYWEEGGGTEGFHVVFSHDRVPGMEPCTIPSHHIPLSSISGPLRLTAERTVPASLRGAYSPGGCTAQMTMASPSTRPWLSGAAVP